MADFSMQHYYNQYIEAETALRRLGERIKGMRERLLYTSEEDFPAVNAQIAAVEEEYRAAKVEVDDLWCLANTGKHRAELTQEASYHEVKRYGGFHAHWPER